MGTREGLKMAIHGSNVNIRRPAAVKSVEVAFLLGCLVTALLFEGPRQLRHGTADRPRQLALEGSSAGRRAPTLPPPLPWKPLLTPRQLRRGLAFYGGGRRIEHVAALLLAGQPITAVTVGASVTAGSGSSNQRGSSKPNSYPERFFQYLNATFPHRGHVLLNKGIGATSSGIFAVCVDKMVPQDSDLVVVELTFNEPADIPFTYPHRRGFEKMLRKLARLPRSPAVIVLHHYAWHYSNGDGMSAGLFYRAAEAQLGTLAQYYDFPSVSVRNSLYPLMQADVAPFKVGRVHKTQVKSLAGEPLKVVGPKLAKDYFYYDGIHPSDTGHLVMAELLAGVVHTAVHNVVADGKAVPLRGSRAQLKPIPLPPPMIPGNADAPTSLCAMQEDFKPLAREVSGFVYQAERPRAKTFVEQKWGWRGEALGTWVELGVNTEESPGQQGNATVYLGHLRSYRGMGTARVECRSGCTCDPTLADGLWKDRVSLMQMHSFQVTQHPSCIIRITIVDRPANSTGSSGSSSGGDGPGSSSSGSSDGDGSGSSEASSSSSSSPVGHKFQVSALMVAHEPIYLDLYANQASDLASAAAGR